MPALDSLWKRNLALLEPAYEHTFDILGNAGVILPLVDHITAATIGRPNSTTFVTRQRTSSGLEAVFTWSEPPSAFATPCDLSDPTNWQGCVPLVTFNGTDEEADTPDAAKWTLITGADNDAPFTMTMWANITDTAAIRALLSKWSVLVGNRREWIWFVTSSDTLELLIRDESASVGANRISDAALTSMGRMAHYAVTYDGGGGATAANGIVLYVDGAVVASTATNDASYVGMEDLAGVVGLGVEYAGASGVAQNWFSGKMAGGPCGPSLSLDTVLTAAQIKRLYSLGKALMGL